MAEACRNRTDPSRRNRDADGFEVREGHQTPCASEPIISYVASRLARTTMTEIHSQAIPPTFLSLDR